jgi:hypothetical protein
MNSFAKSIQLAKMTCAASSFSRKTSDWFSPTFDTDNDMMVHANANCYQIIEAGKNRSVAGVKVFATN